MTVIKQDPRVVKTQTNLRRALVYLMQHEKLENISVQKITKTANITRGTFYLHYRDKQDFVEAAMNGIIDQLFEHVLEKGTPREVTDGKILQTMSVSETFSYIEKNADVFTVLLSGQQNHYFYQQLYNRLTEVITNYAKHLKQIKKIMKKINDHNEEDVTLTDCTISEVLSDLNEESFEVDPALLVTIILCRQQNHLSPFFVYFRKSKVITHDNNFVYYKNQIICPRTFQTLFYMHSNACEIFWKIAFAEGLEHNMFSDICPVNMFYSDNNYKCGEPYEGNGPFGFIDLNFNFAEVLQRIFDHLPTSYETRHLIGKAVILLSDFGGNSLYKDFMTLFRDNYHLFITDEESAIACEHPDVVEEEIKNFFLKQIETTSKIKNGKYLLNFK